MAVAPLVPVNVSNLLQAQACKGEGVEEARGALPGTSHGVVNIH